MRAPSDVGLRIRPYEEGDEAAVLDLMRVALGEGPSGARSARFFRWKHFENPFGRSLLLVAEVGGRIVGLRAFMRWRFTAEGGVLRAVRAVDTATHPEFQGRGIFRRLTMEGIEALRGQADLVFNTPNDKSLPGYLKMGWRVVGRIRVFVRIRRPLRMVRGISTLRDSPSHGSKRPEVQALGVAEVLEGADGLPGLLVEAGEGEPRLATPKSADFLRWRYGSSPTLDYRAVREPGEGPLRGLGIFRVRPRGRLWEATLAELIARDRRAARRLLTAVAHAAPVDHVTCRFPRGSAASGAALSCGFIPAPGGMTLVVNSLNEDLIPDPTQMRSWALSLGDLEVF